MPTYNSIEEMILATADAVRPPERITVSEAAERYHIVKNPGQHEGPFSLDKTPYLREPMDVLTSLDYTGMIFTGPARTGKALALDTPIATPTGWTTMGDLRVGDTIFDERGEPCAVTFTTEVMNQHDCYRVEFDDGSEIVADAGHKWKVQETNNLSSKPKVVTTLEMVEAGLRFERTNTKPRWRYAIEVTQPLRTEVRDLPIDPYLLGLWLGDGSSKCAKLTAHKDDVPHYVRSLRERGYKVFAKLRKSSTTVADISVESNIKTSLRHFCPRGHDKRILGINALKYCVACARENYKVYADGGKPTHNRKLFTRHLAELNLKGNKHIPEIYLRASYEQRLELLRGLMDTDGCATITANCNFTTSIPTLADGFSELIVTLGLKARHKIRPTAYKKNGVRVECSPSHSFHFVTDKSMMCFTLPRKVERLRDELTAMAKRRSGFRNIVAIVPIDSVSVRCITVDSPSHLFLAGRSMIPTHNSSMAINWLCHTAITDPADIAVIHMAQHTARDWSQADLAKALRNSPELKKRLMPGRQNDNVFDKHFLSGMRLLTLWPTINNLSGKTIPRLWLMDFDRMPQDIDGEGNPYSLAAKRAQTFRRYGMTVAEASPGFDIEDPKWLGVDPHEAPPAKGILSLYNRGDRRRWYWVCPHCESAFQPQFKLLQWPTLDSKDIMEMAERTEMYCPHCGSGMKPNQQRELNRGGKWVKSGQTWHPATDEVTGSPRRSDIASFWMFGPAAGFTDWPELVKKYLNALQDYESTGDEGPLRTTTNVDQGEAYLPKSLEGGRLPETLKNRAEDWGGHNENGEPYVPERTRFLVATVDVQAGGRPSFVVHIFGVAEGFDIFHVDMFKIAKSERLNEVGEREGLDPAAHPEDWDLLTSQVLDRSYPLNDQSGRRMAVKIAACDSGGADGVTANAYDFYRKLRSNGQADRFHLVKGAPSKSETAPIRITYPNAQQKDKFATARGDVPVWLVNSNIVKDQVNNMLGRDEPGGQIHFPRWAQDWLYSQLTTEIRDPSKGWINPSRRRNEAFDLLAYCVAICDHPDIRIRFIDWENPPIWASEWDSNPLVFGGDAERPAIEGVKKRLSLEELGAALG